MTYSNTHSESNTYSEAEIKDVLGRVYDDFHAIDARGFYFFKGNYLKEIRADLYFLLTKNALKEFQFKFNYDAKTIAIHYKVNPFGAIINRNNPSGGIDYYEFPKNSDISVIISRKYDNDEVNKYMTNRGWTKEATFYTGTYISQGSYSKGNLSIDKSVIR